jgi:phosphoserine/homoserine phosphotransferase
MTGKIACLDLEGVLIPEVWVNLAERTGIEELTRTTQHEPDYDALMKWRLGVLAEHSIGMKELEETIGDMEPLPGAPEFMEWLRARYQVVILSDTFYEFGMPFMAKLGMPTLFCHKLEVNEGGKIVDYTLRMKDHKRAAISAFRLLQYTTLATGDSYNDTTMLGAADRGILYDAPQNVIDEFPQFPVARGYDELKDAFLRADAETGGVPATR